MTFRSAARVALALAFAVGVATLFLAWLRPEGLLDWLAATGGLCG